MTAKFVLEIHGGNSLSHQRIGQYLDQLEQLLGVPLEHVEIRQNAEGKLLQPRFMDIHDGQIPPAMKAEIDGQSKL